MNYFKHLLVCFYLMLCCFCFAQETSEVKELDSSPFNIGETVNIYSKVLNEARAINVYLPATYESDTAKKYPVIYLLDGSKDEDFIHIAGLVQFGTFSWINMLPESIVIGIANVDRKRDFTYPSNNAKDKEYIPQQGGSEQFIQFIEKELQRFVAKKYRTTNDKTIIGQSLGGLLATEILFKRPNLFDKYIIVSPSLWWDDESLLKTDPVSSDADKSIYVAVGKEGEVMERVANVLYQKLEKLGRPNTQLFFEFLDKRDHGDALHEAVYHAFEQFYPKAKK